MIGGKWTTFRAFAEQTTDAVLAELGRQRRLSTLDLSIGGGAGFPPMPERLVADLADEFAVSPARARYLVDHYGTNARDVVAFCASRDDDVKLDDTAETTHAEVVYLARREYVVGVADVVLRRTSLAIRGDISMRGIGRIADALAQEFGWDAVRRDSEIESVVNDLTTYHGVSRDMLERRSTSGAGHEDQHEGPVEPDVHERQLS